MGRPVSRCQCLPGCRQPPMKGSPFCASHQTCSRRSPTTGWEPDYHPERYNRLKGDRESHNCFAYAFDYLQRPKGCTDSSCPIPYPQPGRASGYKTWSKMDGKRCPDLMARLMGDIPGIQIGATFEAPCPKGMRKIATVVDPKEDYHFYRQDRSGMWSHKPGGRPVTNKDGSGRPIYDPALAHRVTEEANLNYKQFCGYQCVPVVRHGKKTTFRLGRGGRRSSRRVHLSGRRVHLSARRSSRRVHLSARRSSRRVHSTRRNA